LAGSVPGLVALWNVDGFGFRRAIPVVLLFAALRSPMADSVMRPTGSAVMDSAAIK
jgi:uncharacterized protein YaaW (UPF0174 family)